MMKEVREKELAKRCVDPRRGNAELQAAILILGHLKRRVIPQRFAQNGS
jgi:hypothetical protein